MEPIKLNPRQIQNTLKFIDTTQSEAVKQCIFEELGQQCFCANGFADRLEPYRGKHAEYLRPINEEHGSPHWESILPDGDGKAYILTGVVVDRCVCSFADGRDAPLSLCDYCCKEFQRCFFSTLFDRAVDIEITASYLKGDDRCSTIIRFV